MGEKRTKSEDSQSTKRKKKTFFTRMSKALNPGHLFSKKKNTDPYDTSKTDENLEVGIVKESKNSAKKQSLEPIPSKNVIDSGSKKVRINEEKGSLVSSENTLISKKNNVKINTQSKSNVISKESLKPSYISEKPSEEQKQIGEFSPRISDSFAKSASSVGLLTPPNPNSSITARVTHSQVFLPWSYLLKSMLFGINFLLLLIILAILTFSWGYENSIQNELCCALFWKKTSCFRFPYFILMAYVYSGLHILYVMLIIFWHPIRKIWINWRPKPSKFSQVYPKKAKIPRKEYVQLVSSMSVIHPIYNLLIIAVSTTLIVLIFLFSKPWLVNVWIASFCTLISCATPILSLILCVLLSVFLVIWVKNWINLKRRNMEESIDTTILNESTSKLGKFFSSKKNDSDDSCKYESDRGEITEDSIVARPSGLSIYSIRMISLWLTMFIVGMLAVSVCIAFAVYVPESFVYYPKANQQSNNSYRQSENQFIPSPPKIFATGGLTISNAGYMIAPHTLPAFYTALSDSNIAGVATSVYFTSDNVAIVMGSESETGLYSTTNILEVFSDSTASSWRDLTLQQLEQLQIINLDSKKYEKDTDVDQLPRIAILADLLNLMKDFPEKRVHLTINNEISERLEDILELIHNTSSQDQVILVLQSDAKIDLESFQSALLVSNLAIASQSFNEFIITGPGKILLQDQENSNTIKYSIDHISPRWDMKRRVWCQNTYGIFTNEPILTENQLKSFSKTFAQIDGSSLLALMSYDTWIYYRNIALGTYCVIMALHLIMFFVLYIIYTRNIEKWRKRKALEV